ncbi:hypothetical protein QYE76_067791 [Lolium multiflorum]|uniref:CCHC-type domain-containing protein n=1 Tax=Lolium multiflorum TaxID=4521 RepID=A0AAD8SD28_LOLMU|nr:hypothetical protein QYE76_067791 [Lolium multiflorum]
MPRRPPAHVSPALSVGGPAVSSSFLAVRDAELNPLGFAFPASCARFTPAHALLEAGAASGESPGSSATRPPPLLNEGTPVRPRSYLEAAKSPPLAFPPPPARPVQTLDLSGCFRCLSTLHKVRDCRDPIRCRGCGRSGHRLRECTMPFPQPTFVPTVTTPRPAVPSTTSRRRATPYPSALQFPLSPSPGARRARSASHPPYGLPF